MLNAIQGYPMRYLDAVKTLFVRIKGWIAKRKFTPCESMNVWESTKTYKHPQKTLGVGIGRVCMEINSDSEPSYYFRCDNPLMCGRLFRCIYGSSCEFLQKKNFPPLKIPCPQDWAAKIQAEETHPKDKMSAKACPVCGCEISGDKEVCPACLREESLKLGDLETRTVCSDGSCIGVIGTNGRCNVCGKSKS